MAKTVSPNTGILTVYTFFTLLLVNSIVLYIAQIIRPSNIVIGTHALGYFWGIGMSMGKLALIGTLAMPIIHEIENRRGRMFSDMEWIASYFVINFVSLWIITRFSEQFGLGVTSWYVVVILAAIMDVVQGVAMMSLQKKLAK